MAEASAPASAANLGPAFDCMAVAIEVRCHVEAEPSGGWSVDHCGSERPPVGAADAVLAAAQLAVGRSRPLALCIRNDIPIGRGMGSSSAAYAAGIAAAWRAVGEDHTLERMFELVAEMEGHPDNAAAAVYGGLVLTDAHGGVHRLPWHPSLHLVVAVPTVPFPTQEARRVVPTVQPIDAVVRGLARTGALVGGLLTADPGLLAAAGGDELHENPRSKVRPEVEGLIAAARAGGALHACWSGAGPSVLAITTTGATEGVVAALGEQLAGQGTVLVPGVATLGVV